MLAAGPEVCSTSGRESLSSAQTFHPCRSGRKLALCPQHMSSSRYWSKQNVRADKLTCLATPNPNVRQYPELEKLVEEKETKGTETPIKITFRAVNTFDLWIWFELYRIPSKDDKDLLETVLESWFVIGRLGGFNGMNLQVSQNAGGQSSFYKYETDDTESATSAIFMNYTEVETKGKWCRFWLNMGTADEVALDILINALSVFSKENVGIKQLIIGGANPDWPVENRTEQALQELNDPNIDAKATRLN